MQIGSPSKRQELGCGTESRSIPAQSKPTTDSAIACSKNYKAKGSILCASIFDQWLLWSGSRPAVQKIMFTSNLRESAHLHARNSGVARQFCPPN